jgi:putative SOS response-associated peptidase YedK
MARFRRNRGQHCVFAPAAGFYEWHLNEAGDEHPFFTWRIRKCSALRACGIAACAPMALLLKAAPS